MFFPGDPLNYPPNSLSPVARYDSARAPTNSDIKNFNIGDEWLDTTNNEWYKLTSKSTNGSALWCNICAGSTVPLSVPDGGTGLVSISQNAVVVGDGTDPLVVSTVRVSDNGEMTNPSQPAFAATLNSGDNDVTGDGATYIFGTNVAFTVLFDQGADLDASGALFTAPVAGRYNFFTLPNTRQTGTATQGSYRIVTSNRTFIVTAFNPENCRNAGGPCNFTSNVLADMAIADTTFFEVSMNGNGADTIDLSTDTNIGGNLVVA
ncbi:hypothetical protein LCGC14_2453380 [marine sediment metagenome]|uniref:C1q domain-containing protein n=1 Tax=marine sediment metagenome TaxID=412755 RepID=A0A0F9DSI9_9ZZZZ